jgi:hypothetical protein
MTCRRSVGAVPSNASCKYLSLVRAAAHKAHGLPLLQVFVASIRWWGSRPLWLLVGDEIYTIFACLPTIDCVMLLSCSAPTPLLADALFVTHRYFSEKFSAAQPRPRIEPSC